MSKGLKMSTMDKISIGLAELIGTALLVFLGCMGCVGGFAALPTHVSICLTFGLAVMLIIQIFGHISGAHLNPAVTAAALVYRLVTPIMAAVYFVAQMVGAFMGFGLLKMLTPAEIFSPEGPNSTAPGLCSTIPHPALNGAQAVAIEFMITLCLVWVCCAVWDHRTANHHDSVSIRFGFTITALAMAAGPYTGGSMNPARSFAPALWNGDWTLHWVYWIGPLAAAVLGTFAYRAVFWRPPPASLNQIEELPLNSRDKQMNN